MTKEKVECCPKCGGNAQFYHVVGDVSFGYCKCEICGHKQKKIQDRDTAVAQWNSPDVRMKRIWDNFEEIAEIRKSDGIKFVIAAATRKGFRYLNIREFYLRKKDGVWKPGRDGITIPMVAPLNKGEEFIHPYDELIKALSEAAVAVQDMELINEEKAIWAEIKKKGSKEEQ